MVIPSYKTFENLVFFPDIYFYAEVRST